MSEPKVSAKFVVGERVLCFEPNPSKARVLYDAKILDVDFVKDGKAKKESEYKVHFQGWNSAWDRWADETFVLKSNEENKKLQRKLAKKAIQKLKRHGRKRVYLPGVSSSKLELDQESSDSDESLMQNMLEEISHESDTSSVSSMQKRPRKKAPSPKLIEAEQLLDLPNNPPSRKTPQLEIPLALQRRLEEDEIMINKRNMLVELPSKLSVVQIFENYVKYFALNVARLPSSEKVLKSTDNDIPPPEKSLRLCEESCEELRILFDFILPVVLLYNNEREQYNDTMFHCYIHNQNETDESRNSPNVNPSKRIKTSEDKETIPDTEAAGKQIKDLDISTQKAHHRLTAEERTIAETHAYLIPDQPKLDRTGLANDAQGRRRSSRLSHNLHPDSKTPISPPVSPSIPAHQGTQSLNPNYSVSMEIKIFLRPPLNHIHGLVQEKNFSLLCDQQDRFTCCSPEIKPEQICREIYLGKVGDDVKKALHLSEAWKFRLFPENYQPPVGANAPCSLVYGIQHFLRLFVKLPEIFSLMEIPDHKLKIILKHLQRLLKFLVDYEREIFALSSCYVTNEL